MIGVPVHAGGVQRNGTTFQSRKVELRKQVYGFDVVAPRQVLARHKEMRRVSDRRAQHPAS